MRSFALAILVTGLLLVNSAAADIVIDTFDDAMNGGVSLPAGTPSTQTGLSNTIGGQRYVNQTATGTSVHISGDDGKVHINNGNVKSSVEFTYGASGDLNADLSGETAFAITGVSGLYLTETIYWSIPLTITVWSPEASASTTVIVGDYEIPFTSFTGVDFLDIEKITLFFDESPGPWMGGLGADYSMESFRLFPSRRR